MAAGGPSADAPALSTIKVVASALPPTSTTGVSVRKTRAQLARQNIADSADVLRYFPNLQVRQRYIGDANATLSGRNAGSLQTARSLVYVDGLLISNLMTNGWNGAPRWGIVTAPAIASVDVLYGPYSALYPGNSIGNTVLIHTRLPDRFSAGGSVEYMSQDYRDEYGASGHEAGRRIGAWLGDHQGRWRWLLSISRLKNDAQPMRYATAKVGGDRADAIAVTGASADRNPDGSPRLVYGASDIERTRQDQVTLHVGVQLSPKVSARFTLGGWRDRSTSAGRSFLRDAGGQTVKLGTILVDGQPWTLPDAGLAPARAERTHVLYGAQLDGCLGAGWCWKAVASRYDFVRDRQREATTSAATKGQLNAGSIADMNGSGWSTLDLNASGALWQGNTLHVGAHLDRYLLDSRVHASDDWRHGAAGTLTRAYGGRSLTRALYLQDIQDFAAAWTLTLGLRGEQWRADHGRLADAASRVAWPDRSRSDLSPKASLTWHVAAPWDLRLSLGKAVRYPTVEELFQGSLSNAAIINNNPDLEPERDWSSDLGLMRRFDGGHWRLSLFQDRFADTLYAQTDVTLPVPVTNVQNIASVRVRGAAGALQWRDVLPGVDIDASVAWNQAVTLRDRQYPLADGKHFPRVPRLRASVFADWRFAPGWDAALGVRRSGRQYATLDNSDFIDTYGAVSSFTVVDAKLHWQFTRRWSASLGVNNLGNERYWVYHPYAGRTWFGELSWKL